MSFVRLSVCLVAFFMFLVACSSQGQMENEPAKVEDETYQELKIALTTQPPTLDTHLTSATLTTDIGRNIFETLVTLNSSYQPVLMLAESIDLSDDDLKYTFHLRENVMFHNGDVMEAEDVVASMNRWLEKSPSGRSMKGANFVEEDPLTVSLILEEPISDVLDMLADRVQFPAIMPKEVIESEKAEGVTEYIGTGPFQFKEWRQDQYILLEKFAQYSPQDAPTDGFSGKKEVFIDAVRFLFVPDHSTRIAGLSSGEYHIVSETPNEYYEEFLNDPNFNTYTYQYGSLFVVYNKKQGLAANQIFRKALNAAIHSEDMMKAGYVFEDLYDIDSSYMPESRVDWYSQNGSEYYNQANLDLAKELLEEVGYQGEPITLLSSRDYEYIYHAAVVLKETLEQIGVNVNLELYDWPTVLDRRQEEDLWDIHIGAAPTPVTPTNLLFLNYNWVGWPEDPKMSSLLSQIKSSKERTEAQTYWHELQGYLWEEYLPISLLGQYKKVIVTAKSIEDFSEFEGGILWNVKLAE